MSEIKISCINPVCKSVAYIRTNSRDDPFFTCPKCGPWNGKGKAYREMCEGLAAGAVKGESVPDEGGDWLNGL
jgi:hypothetical protein